MNVKLKSLGIDRFPHERTWGAFDYFIVGHDAEGREWTLMKPLTAAEAAERYCVLTEASWQFEATEDWADRAPYGSSAWLNDGMEERQIEDERMAG